MQSAEKLSITLPPEMASFIRQKVESPTTWKDVTPLIRKPGGLMEQSNASLQRGDQG
jgi:Arc/MetJ-type ribon-helix-helix transcriptional regulator